MRQYGACQMNEDEFQRSLKNNFSEDAKRKNPHLFNSASPVGGQDAQPAPLPALDQNISQQQRGKKALVEVSIIALRKGTVDDDSLPTCSKPLRDIIAHYLGVDDGDRRVRWKYAQCLTTGKTETIVRIELL